MNDKAIGYEPEDEIESSRAPLLDHLIELRSRLVVCVVGFAIAFVVCFFFAADIQIALIKPYQAAAAVHEPDLAQLIMAFAAMRLED